jgi:hypothetical protein
LLDFVIFNTQIVGDWQDFLLFCNLDFTNYTYNLKQKDYDKKIKIKGSPVAASRFVFHAERMGRKTVY